MVKEILMFGKFEIEKKKKKLTAIRPLFKGCRYWGKSFFGEKNYKYFIGYLHNDKVKPLHIMLSKTTAYVKSYKDKLNGCIFWLKMKIY